MNNIDLLPLAQLTDAELVSLSKEDLDEQDKVDVEQEFCRREMCYNG